MLFEVTWAKVQEEKIHLAKRYLKGDYKVDWFSLGCFNFLGFASTLVLLKRIINYIGFNRVKFWKDRHIRYIRNVFLLRNENRNTEFFGTNYGA